jgi:hypothetical protein
VEEDIYRGNGKEGGGDGESLFRFTVAESLSTTTGFIRATRTTTKSMARG